MSKQIDLKILEQLDTKELERLLKEKKKLEKREYERKKRNYEDYRDKMIRELIEEAKRLHNELKAFKQKTFIKLLKFKQYAMKYGDIKKSSKGGFSLRTKDGRLMVKLERNLKNEFDERAELAVQLIQDFLKDKVYKRDRVVYDMIMQLLARNKRGDLNIARVWQLLQMREKFDDPRWVKAMQLMEEAYMNRPVSYSLSFYEKDPVTEKDELLSLSLPSIPVDLSEIQKTMKNEKQDSGNKVDKSRNRGKCDRSYSKSLHS